MDSLDHSLCILNIFSFSLHLKQLFPINNNSTIHNIRFKTFYPGSKIPIFKIMLISNRPLLTYEYIHQTYTSTALSKVNCISRTLSEKIYWEHFALDIYKEEFCKKCWLYLRDRKSKSYI